MFSIGMDKHQNWLRLGVRGKMLLSKISPISAAVSETQHNTPQVFIQLCQLCIFWLKQNRTERWIGPNWLFISRVWSSLGTWSCGGLSWLTCVMPPGHNICMWLLWCHWDEWFVSSLIILLGSVLITVRFNSFICPYVFYSTKLHLRRTGIYYYHFDLLLVV